MHPYSHWGSEIVIMTGSLRHTGRLAYMVSGKGEHHDKRSD